MELLFLLLLFALLWAWAWVLIRAALGRGDGPGPLLRRRDWIVASMHDMFRPVTPKAAAWLLIGPTLGLAALGFALPGFKSTVDRMAVDEAIRFNARDQFSAALNRLQDWKTADSPLVRNELGVAYLGLGHYDLAARELRRAVALAPSYAKAHANLAAAYRDLGQESRSLFEQTRAQEAQKLTVDPDQLLYGPGGKPRHWLLRGLCAVAFGWIGYSLATLGVRLIRRRRMRAYDDQLSDALIMAANGLRAGFSLSQALDMVSRETHPPVSQEFGLVVKEQRLGADLDQALERLAARMPTADTRIFVNSLNVLRETGGNLSQIFDTLAETISERKRVEKKIKAMTAEGETQAWCLAALPIVLGLVLYRLSPETVELFFTTFLGWMMLSLMACMEVMGIFLMLKMARVRV